MIAAIQKCHQTLWGGGRLSPPAAFGELCKVLFVKVRDEKKPRKKGQPYEFQIKTHEESRRLAERIRELYEDVQHKEPEVFTETIKVDDAVIRTLVSHLEGINLNKTDLDTKGVAFEQFMDGFFKGDVAWRYSFNKKRNFWSCCCSFRQKSRLFDFFGNYASTYG